MASNSAGVIDDAESHIRAKLSELPSSAIGTQDMKNQTQATRSETINAFRSQREVGDHVNRFLLCTLVNKSAKRIKASAGKIGESLPITMIVRGVLRSYRLAAKDKYGPLAGLELDMEGLRSLDENILRDEIERHSQERVKNSVTAAAQSDSVMPHAR